jgi:hypothetical protein
MPTLLLQEGFKFFFYANEHLPMHVHVSKGSGYAKINLVQMEVVDNCLKSAELKRAVAIANEHRNVFLEKWHEFFDKR